MAPSKKVMDQRFAEKMAALKEGRAPVFVAESPIPADPIEAANARIQEKIRRHYAKPEPAAKVKTEEAKPPAGDGAPLEKEITALNKAQITERLKSEFGIEVDKDSLNKDKLVALYLEEAAKAKPPAGDG